jgi:hypothetical protein
MLCFLKNVSALEFNFIGQMHIVTAILFLYAERKPREREGEREFSERDGHIDSRGVRA